MEQTTAEREEKEAENSGKKELLELLRSEKESIAGGNAELLTAIEVGARDAKRCCGVFFSKIQTKIVAAA